MSSFPFPVFFLFFGGGEGGLLTQPICCIVENRESNVMVGKELSNLDPPTVVDTHTKVLDFEVGYIDLSALQCIKLDLIWSIYRQSQSCVHSI